MAKIKKEEGPKKVTDIKTALADIKSRADARKKVVDQGQKNLNDARRTSKAKGRGQTGAGKLQGLASLTNTLGTQYYKKTN
jgi:hypothetical protein